LAIGGKFIATDFWRESAGAAPLPAQVQSGKLIGENKEINFNAETQRRGAIARIEIENAGLESQAELLATQIKTLSGEPAEKII
jgi:hypothetical protein